VRSAGARIPANWAQCIVEPDAFRHEQKRLAHVWTFLGLTSDVGKDGDWFKASIATRSVFVQRFGAELRGFENLCVHRRYPLRHADRGNGPIVCGYHHWHYDGEGRAVGIPLCRELFDATPQELGARLNRLELATCGRLIFGRFPAPGATETLEEFLGDGLAILQAASQTGGRTQFLQSVVEANWRLCFHITLDDYHAVAVHPSTLGRGGYVHRKDIGYFRFGLHSAFLNTAEPQAFEKMAAACRDGAFRPSCYCIFQVVPNMLMVLFRPDAQFWYCLVQVYDPVRHDRSLLRAWLSPAPFATRHAWLRRLTDPVRVPIVRYYVGKIFREDNLVCERLQKASHQIDAAPLLGKLEERIEWFEESYRSLIEAGESFLADEAGEA
jgi:phenylpropionate dioxygenase-like ring-hydroxylating dioxygenase large terminal subunit